MKRMITLLATAGCLLFATSCNKDNDKKQFATNKAGERLVEKIEGIWSDGSTLTTSFFYDATGIATKITEEYFDAEDNDHTTDIYAFKKQGDFLLCKRTINGDAGESWTCELSDKGFIITDNGWTGNEKYRLTYDGNDRLQYVYKDNELKKTFLWENDNIADNKFRYIDQPKQSNIDWSAWAHNTESYDEGINTPSIDLAYMFSCSGFLGKKNKGLLIFNDAQGRDDRYEYEFDNEGFVSSITRTDSDGKDQGSFAITYLKR